MPTYANIGGIQKEVRPWYTNMNGAQTLLLSLNGNIGGVQKNFYTSTHRWAKYTYAKTSEFKYIPIDYGESDDIPMGSDAFPNDAYLSRSYSFDQSTGIFTLTGTITQISYSSYYNITLGSTYYGHNYVDLTGYYMIVNGSMSGDMMHGMWWVQTSWVPAYDDYGSWRILHKYNKQRQYRWTPTITYVESENINAYENYAGSLASEYWIDYSSNYVFYNTNTHYKLLY